MDEVLVSVTMQYNEQKSKVKQFQDIRFVQFPDDRYTNMIRLSALHTGRLYLPTGDKRYIYFFEAILIVHLR